MKKIILITSLLLLSLTIFLLIIFNSKSYTITYNLNGGINYNDAPTEYKKKDVLLENPTKIGYKFKGWENESGEYTTVVDSSWKRNIVLNAIWEYEILDLPIMNITIDNNTKLSSINKVDYVGITVDVLNSETYSLSNCKANIRGHGNTTWVNNKKSYKIKFEQKQNLFNLMENDDSKHWVIVGNYIDETLSKNNLAYTLTNEVFNNISYTSKFQNIDLYVNNEYQGVYSVYESVRVEKGRVNISKDYSNVDTGYLLEYDMLVSGTYGIDYFNVYGLPYPFRFDSPTIDDVKSEEQMLACKDYISDYLQKVYYCIINDDFQTLCELADIDSIVDVYLIQELFKNSDAGLSSFYMYKEKGGKLFFGPIWDFDKTCMYCLQDPDYKGLLIGIEFDKNQLVLKASNPIFYNLLKNTKFKELVQHRWNEIYDKVITTINNFIDVTSLNTLSFQRNFVLWKECTTESIENNLNELQNWLINRSMWLKENNWK